MSGHASATSSTVTERSPTSSDRLDADNRMHVVEMPLVIKRQRRIALVDGIDEFLLGLVLRLAEIIHPQPLSVAVRIRR